MTQNLTQVNENTSKRGGKRPQAGRKTQPERANDIRVRISEVQHLHWNEVKILKKLPNDNAVAKYLLDLAADFDEQVESSTR